MRVLLTGATGFIGTRLRSDLLTSGHDVVAVTRGRPDADTPHCAWVRMDLADTAAAIPPIDGAVDAVVYLAQAREYREFPEKAPAIFGVNAAGVFAWLDWARTRDIRCFVYASSANVYASSRAPIAESAPVEPMGFYGRSKHIGEMLVTAYGEFFRCVVLRLFTVYGPGQTGMLIPSLIDKVSGGQPIQLQGADGLLLSPLFVADAARFIAAALSGAERGAELLNLGGDEALTLRAMGQQIAEALGRTASFRQLDVLEPGGWASDNTRRRERFSISALTSFSAGIRQTIAGTSTRA